jgi:hypothetical protein
MSASLRALLAGVIDYAGLFPPARLPLDRAARHYARYRTEPESWMLGRFICPASRLKELAPFEDELLQAGPPVFLSAPGRGGNTLNECVTGLVADLEAVAAFRQRSGDRLVVDAFETRLPSPLVERHLETVSPHWVAGSEAQARRLAPERLSISFETGLGPDWRESLPRAVQALGGYNHSLAQVFPTWGRLGFKLRCGGLEASAFPSPEQVALVLAVCRDAGVPLKFTAGLHHPIRRYDPEVRATMHGFLNVVGAGVLAHAHGLNAEQLRPIIEEEDPAAFRFDETEFRWRDLSASVEEVTVARRHVVGFGSCSFDEPRDDLRALGLLS